MADTAGGYFPLQEGPGSSAGGPDKRNTAPPDQVSHESPGEPRGAVVTALETQPAAEEREWEGDWLDCCGGCDGTGWGVCCLTLWCFPCVFGCLNYRAFGNFRRALGWGVLFTILVFLPYTIDTIFWEDELEDSDDDDRTIRTKFKEHETLLLIVFWVVGSLSFLIITIVGFWNRTHIRRKFGIQGQGGKCCGASPEVGDACLWTFCKPCATCQEARTLVVNRVERGEWQGAPAMGYANGPYSAAVPPPPQGFQASPAMF